MSNVPQVGDRPKARRGKGEGTIHRRNDGRFEGRLSFGSADGKRHRASVYGATRTEVARKLRKLQAKFGRNVSKLRIDDHLDRWLEDGKARWEPQTFRTYRSLVTNHIVPLLGKQKVFDLNPPEIRVWMRRLEDAGVGAAARKRSLSILRSSLKQLVDDWQLERNPCDPVRGPKVRRQSVRIPTGDEIKRLLHAAEPFWLFAFVLLAITCAMREGEIFALYWSQIDLERGRLHVDRSLADGWDGKPERKGPKNKMSLRSLFLTDIAVRTLRRLRDEQLLAGYEGPWVFPDSFGGPLRKSNFIRREWRTLLERAGLEYFNFHVTRHWSSSVLIEQGEDPLLISRHMGHVDTRMTFDTYGHLFAGAGRRAAASMERGLSEAGILGSAFGLGNEGRE